MSLWLQASVDGQVFGRTEDRPAVKLADSVGSFLEGQWNDEWVRNALKGDPYIHVYGVGQNAELLLGLCAHLDEIGVAEIMLHRPFSRLAPAGLQRYQELKVNTDSYPASLGGPRRFTLADAITCKMQLQATKKNDDPSWGGLLELAKDHPAWPAFTFLPFVRERSAIRLIATLGDPRWYINPKRSDSSQDLITAFGLGRDGLANMATLAKCSAQYKNKGSMCAALVTFSWCPIFMSDGEARVCSHEDVSRDQRKRWIISDYLGEESKYDGMLVASRKFLRAVCAVWLNNLTPPRAYRVDMPAGKRQKMTPRMIPSSQYSPELFNPKHEFGDNIDELIKWGNHMDEWLARRAPRKAEQGSNEGAAH